jgi:hypothetical protein
MMAGKVRRSTALGGCPSAHFLAVSCTTKPSFLLSVLTTHTKHSKLSPSFSGLTGHVGVKYQVLTYIVDILGSALHCSGKLPVS